MRPARITAHSLRSRKKVPFESDLDLLSDRSSLLTGNTAVNLKDKQAERMSPAACVFFIGSDLGEVRNVQSESTWTGP